MSMFRELYALTKKPGKYNAKEDGGGAGLIYCLSSCSAEGLRCPRLFKMLKSPLVCHRLQWKGRTCDWRSVGDLGKQKGQIMWQAAEDALTFYRLFWSQRKGRGLGGGSSLPVVN